MDASKRSKVIAGIKLAAQALKNESTNQQSQHSVESELVPTLDSPFVPTPESVIVTFLAQLQPSDCVLDIGFGDGRVVMSAALCGHAVREVFFVVNQSIRS
jgi:tRNA G46 methylase TrmB